MLKEWGGRVALATTTTPSTRTVSCWTVLPAFSPTTTTDLSGLTNETYLNDRKHITVQEGHRSAHGMESIIARNTRHIIDYHGASRIGDGGNGRNPTPNKKEMFNMTHWLVLYFILSRLPMHPEVFWQPHA